MANALYICYFGLRQPLVQTQVLPYLRELRKDGHEITLLTFEPEFSESWTEGQLSTEGDKLLAEGIGWRQLPYHKRFSAAATAYDILRGTLKARGIIEEKGIDIIHGRVHVPTLMGALARKLSRRKPKLLFDIRGFFPEEYTDAGIWPENGILYRSAKRVEKWLMKEADGFVLLTEKACGLLFPDRSVEAASRNSEAEVMIKDSHGRPIEVIPCCVDLENRFSIDLANARKQVRAELSLGNRFVLVHAGALGGLYLTEKIADLLAAARERDDSVFAMFLTQSDPAQAISLLKDRGFGPKDFFVDKVAPERIPAYLSSADAGLSFVKAGYATASRSPTKIPEYLACGLPVIANEGVGDVDKLIEKNRVGILVREFSRDAYMEALNALPTDDDIRARCGETARREFDLLEIGGVRYRRLYRRLMQG